MVCVECLPLDFVFFAFDRFISFFDIFCGYYFEIPSFIFVHDVLVQMMCALLEKLILFCLCSYAHLSLNSSPSSIGIDLQQLISERRVGEGSESPQMEQKRVEKNDVSGVGEGSKRPQMERNRVEKNDVSGVETGANTSHGQMGGSWKSRREFMRFINSYNSEIRSCDRHYVKIALEAYEKRTGVKHEIKRILFTHRKSVLVPGYEGVREWCHVSFTAKPKNTDHRPKHFFGEMVLDPISGTRDVTHCSTFEPSGAGLTYGCGFCPESPSVLHPAYAYRAGLPSSTYPTKLSYDYVVAL